MTTTLTIQIIVYMVILAFIAFAWGYSKGHKDGMLMGRIQARKLERLAKAAK
jgi:heme/copper-type cytochrome/quinol oxidase subunit 2